MTAAQVGEVLARAKAAQEAEQMTAAQGGDMQQDAADAPTPTGADAEHQAQDVNRGRYLIPGPTLPDKPHHHALIDLLRAGAKLKELTGGKWILHGGGRAPKLEDARKVSYMLKVRMLVYADEQHLGEDMQHAAARVG